jgi:outer membrane receptor protein involved in Fe transport
MRKVYILVLILNVIGFISTAQAPGGGGRAGGGGNMNMGHLYGRIVDKSSNKPIESASVEFVQSKFDTVSRKRKDTVIAGMFTDKRGEFSLEQLPLMGNFRLRITIIGYKSIEQKVAFDLKPGGGTDMLNAMDKDLGNIKIEQDATTLQQVTVTGSKSLVQLAVDRKVFNVEKNIGSVGGTAVDVMRNVPSVSVDIDGNVTMRNNAPQIFVDGRPSTLTLDQIPADAIATVELITNPSAKFDASGGTSGIINIVLKKNKKAGYSGNLRAGVDSRGKINTGADINVRQGKFNVFANANYGQRLSKGTGVTDRTTLNTDPHSISHQEDKNQSEGYFGFGRLGIDYFLDNRNTITVSGTAVRGHFAPFTESDIFYNREGSVNPDTLSQRFSNTAANFRNIGTMLSYKHNFPKAGQEWTADLNFNRSNNDNYNTVKTGTYAYEGGPLLGNYTQIQDGGGTNRFFIAQTDYTNPLGEKSKFETGARMSIRDVNSSSLFGIVQPDGSIRYEDSLSSIYSNEERVFAAYGTYSNMVKNFGYQLGLRAESSDYNGTLTRTYQGKDSLQNFHNSYPISLFPSVFLTQKLKHDQDLQLNYTRRINRPNFFQLFPFIDFSDSLNLTQGNPNLKPEFTNSLEASYQKSFQGNNSILVSVYYKNTTNLITRYAYDTVIAEKHRILNTYINANSSDVYGLELTDRTTLFKIWELNTNFNLYSSKININQPGIPNQDRIFSFFTKINNNIKLPKNITLQITGDYTSKTVLPPGGSGGNFGGGGGGRGFGGGGGFFGQAQSTSQGYIRETWGVDVGVRYEFLKDKRAQISLNMNDIFRTRRSDIHSESPYFIQDALRRRDAQIVRLNFNYRFGKFDVSLFKRKNLKGEQDSMQQGMQGVQQ